LLKVFPDGVEMLSQVLRRLGKPRSPEDIVQAVEHSTGATANPGFPVLQA
jgi:hypothetical protein